MTPPLKDGLIGLTSNRLFEPSWNRLYWFLIGSSVADCQALIRPKKYLLSVYVMVRTAQNPSFLVLNEHFIIRND